MNFRRCYNRAVHIVVNGEGREIEGEVSLPKLLQELGVRMERIAVERNSELVPRSAWNETTVREGDRLEIVHFVGGG